ncbi:MAG: Trk family potassium uptake protein [Candidatus Aureabacteria bacterium]|nr:Trk family potassium uptake protein [Candidatus Auribacterota bacterium]
MNEILKKKTKKINPPKLIFFSYLAIIILGAFLLSLPASVAGEERLQFVDAVFLSTSATCVTGLVVKNIGVDLSIFGQIVILALIQIGGLGIMTMSTFFLLIIGKKLSMRDQLIIRDSLDKTKRGGVTSLIKSVLLFTFITELLGAAFLYIRFKVSDNPVLPYGSEIKLIYYSVFHAVSAFCNAGFTLFTNNLEAFSSDPAVISIMAALIILGGLGFLVVFNIQKMRFWKTDKTIKGRLSLHSKIVLTSTLILLVFGAVIIGSIEWDNTLKDLSIYQKIQSSIFCATTPRTAGFNIINTNSMKTATLFFIMFLMFVGASPGSTGGGIKTCTLAILVATTYSMIKGNPHVTIYKRTVPHRIVQEAISIVIISTYIILIAATFLLITEQVSEVRTMVANGYLAKILFEVISAFGTVGLSTGITPYLSTIGKFLVIIIMLVGRISPLTIALIVGKTEDYPSIKYPEETVMVG